MYEADRTQNQFTGVVRPILKKRKYRPPFFDANIPLGKSGKYFTKLSVYVRGPSLEYPEIGIFIQFANGRSTTFARVQPEELQLAADFFHEAQEKVAKAMIDLQPQIDEMRAVFEAAAHKKADLMQLAQLMKGNLEDLGPDDDEEVQSPWENQ